MLYAETVGFPAFRIVGTNVLLKDEAGDLMQLSMYNFVPDSSDPAERLPVGSRLAILEPYMKHSQDRDDMNLMLRCDNPQCIVVFD